MLIIFFSNKAPTANIKKTEKGERKGVCRAERQKCFFRIFRTALITIDMCYQNLMSKLSNFLKWCQIKEKIELPMSPIKYLTFSTWQNSWREK